MNWKIEWLDITASTQSELKTRFNQGLAVDGCVLATQSQTTGFGRKQRHWVSPVGNLSFSFLFSSRHTHKAYQYNLLASLILCQTLESIDPRLACQIKWPNDVWYNGKKMAGMLSEALDNTRILMGIGLNLNTHNNDFPIELRTQIQTVQDILGQPLSAKFVLEQFLQDFANAHATYEKSGLSPFLPRIQNRLQFKNQDVHLSESDSKTIGRGRLLGLDDDGLVILQENAHPPVKYIAGDLSLFGEI